MKGKLKILMVFPEVAPFTMTGEIGKVGGALPRALKEMEHDVRVITPQYRSINERKYVLRDVIRLQNIGITLGNEKVSIDVKSAFLPQSKVQVYFIDYKPFFFREGMYADSKQGKKYSDNDKRFILFSKGVLKTLIKLQWQPDIIHCHDWQSGLVPFFLETFYKADPFFEKTFTLFTVHNFDRDGNFDQKCTSFMREDDTSPIPVDTFEHDKLCSFLKAGIVHADLVNTTHQEYTQGMVSQKKGQDARESFLLWSKGNTIHRIANGIDYNTWNPETDGMIPKAYAISDIGSKEENKLALLKSQGLSADLQLPVMAVISDLMDQAGRDLIRNCFHDLVKLGGRFIFLGKGDKAYQQFLTQIRKKYKDRVCVNLNHDESLDHLLIAGADILLMLSNHSIIESSRMYCLKYGTIPIVYYPKKSEEIIHVFNPDTGKGSIFAFKVFDERQFSKTMKRAIRTFEDRKLWLKIVKNGMREDFSWNQVSKRYVQLYGKCLLKKR